MIEILIKVFASITIFVGCLIVLNEDVDNWRVFAGLTFVVIGTLLIN